MEHDDCLQGGQSTRQTKATSRRSMTMRKIHVPTMACKGTRRRKTNYLKEKVQNKNSDAIGIYDRYLSHRILHHVC